MEASERIHRERRASHPQNPALQSSSVPSTPHQAPRDLRFPSRSPSPGKTYSNRQSPRSRADTTYTAQPTAPLVCKFESGAEFRKRRVPYKDGGNEPLPPASQQPKPKLDTDQESQLTEGMRQLYLRLLPSQESESRRTRLVEKLERILNEEWPGNDIKVNVFGSSGNLLASNDSDVDICITTSLKSLESMHSLATVLHRHGMERVVCRAAAKVPIVKLWDPELELACDMNVNNTLALENTRMIKTYVQIDERVRPLAKIIKYWTKQRILNDAAFGGTISSYTWICMIINFLQTRDPPVLPSLQQLDESHRSTIDGKPSPFADDIALLKSTGSKNAESLGSLLFHFFRYYAYELDYTQSVVSVRAGRVLTRKEKGWDVTNYQDKEARVRLCVEEPFTVNRNLGNSADDYAFSGIHEEIRRAFDLVAAGKLDECCAEYVFPPEEKPLFQRPAPKPKPTLTRSASQSGRGQGGSGNAKGHGKENRTNRTSSGHKNNNRRASSGATYGNARYSFTSPAMGPFGSDYFGSAIPNDQLHEQLYKQYQYLQAQQELLRSQLLQQQNYAQLQAAQAQAHQNLGLRVQDLSTGSPRQHGSRPSDAPPATAPLLPGYLYHYPARYAAAPGSPISQTRSQDGPATLPSSPSLPTNLNAARRGSHRVNATEGFASSSVRSQSQPGRSFPSPATLQSLAHPGFDVSGAIGTPFLPRPQQYSHMHPHQHQQHGYAPMGPYSAGPYQIPFDTTMPKEYVGYYMGQSPQLFPQLNMDGTNQVPVFGDMQSAHPRSSPDRQSPLMWNAGVRKQSRSPSPLRDRRSSATSTNSRSAPLPQGPFPESPQRQLRPSNLHDDGPVIVNGSSPQTATMLQLEPVSPLTRVPVPVLSTTKGSGTRKEDTKPIPQKSQPVQESGVEVPKVSESTKSVPQEGSQPRNQPSSSRSTLEVEKPPPKGLQESRSPNGTNSWQSGSSFSAALRARPPPPLDLSLPKSSELEPISAGAETKPTQTSPATVPPLLSPVAEMRTPSPASSRGNGSPKNENKGNITTQRIVHVANGQSSNGISTIPGTKALGTVNELMPDNPQLPVSRQPVSVGNNQNTNEWQQATRKHRKAKSQGVLAPGRDQAVTSGGVNGNERKGG